MSKEDFVIPQSIIDGKGSNKSKLVQEAVIPDEALDLAFKSVEKRREATSALQVEFGEGLTLGFLGELAAVAQSATSDKTYAQAKREYENAREKFKEENPALAKYALPLEILGSLPSGGILFRGLTKAGASAAGAGAGEGALYGAGTGETFEERAGYAAFGGLAGFTIGKVIDVATKPKAQGGLKTEADDVAEEVYDIDTQSAQRAIDEAENVALYTEVDNPQYTRTPLRDAQTAGELWDGMIGAVKNFYDDKLTGVSDRLIRRVSPDVGGRFQRADETALRVIDKDLGKMQESLIPVIKAINESDRAKGILLDYASGQMLTKDEIFKANAIARKASSTNRDIFRKSLQAKSLARLEQELGQELSTEHMAVLKQYLQYSASKNNTLNKKIFGASFDTNPNAAINLTFLHTRNRARANQLKEEGMSEADIERMFDDSAFKPRTRGQYLDDKDPNRPVVADYDNPLVSDMRRIFKMERLNQIQQKFGVDLGELRNFRSAKSQSELAEYIATGLGIRRSPEEIASYKAAIQEQQEAVQSDRLLRSQIRASENPQVALTPDQFMDAFELTLRKKGISDEGAAFARNQITEAIMGQSATPHPLIQAANSTAYALTLAGPLSAVLNLADIPLVGAKYGGSAVREGAKVVVPGKFKTVPNVDLEKAGLSNQTFGEFVNIINDQASDSAGWMVNTAEKMRKSADFLMRKSGFAAFDRIGKQGVMRGVLKSAADDAQAGRLADNWSFYFNQAELDIIQSQLKKHGQDWRKYTGKGKELIEELMFAGLGQQQLISAAGRPAAWARHPNLRPLWALRGFVVKQQALALREVVDNIKAGKPEKAAEFLGRYAVYGAGGYAAINEGRQFLFGDGEVSASGIARGYGDAWASLLTANTLGLNDYQFGKIKQNGLVLTFAQGLLPIAVTRPFDIAGTAIGVADREYPAARLASEVPIIRDVGRVSRNIGERTGIEPLEQFGGMMTQKRLAED